MTTGARWAETRCTARAKARRSIISGTAGQRLAGSAQRRRVCTAAARQRGLPSWVRPRERTIFTAAGLRARALSYIDQLLA